jgi:hypothetical protein
VGGARDDRQQRAFGHAPLDRGRQPLGLRIAALAAAALEGGHTTLVDDQVGVLVRAEHGHVAGARFLGQVTEHHRLEMPARHHAGTAPVGPFLKDRYTRDPGVPVPALRIHQYDATPADHQVVDVRPRARQRPIVQHRVTSEFQ